MESRYFNKVIRNGANIFKNGNREKIVAEYLWYKEIRKKDHYFNKYITQPSELFVSVGGNRAGYKRPSVVGESLDYVYLKCTQKEKIDLMHSLILWIHSVEPCILQDKKLTDKAKNFYINNTNKRLRSSIFLFRCLNGKENLRFEKISKQFLALWSKFQTLIYKYVCSDINSNLAIIHGDLNFTNIFIRKNLTFGCIDPRGTFFDTHYSVEGDCRYDYAKVRQCYSGCYQYLAAINDDDDFELVYHELNELHTSNYLIVQSVDRFIQKQKISLLAVQIIQAIQFVRMVPLHADSRLRQILLMCEAINEMNQILEKVEINND